MVGKARIKLREDEETPIFRPTPDMIADAHRRNAAPRPLTAWLMGDPAPGQSALDKRVSYRGDPCSIASPTGAAST